MEKLIKLFLEQLADIYDAEQRLTRVIPRLTRYATDETLRTALHHHMVQKEFQIQRLTTIFELVGKRAAGRKCHTVVGLIEDAHDLVIDNKAFASINAATACALQKIEHYEIASYSCLVQWARQLGLEEAYSLLLKTLQEEEATEKVLGQFIASDFSGSPDTDATAVSS